MTTEVKQSQFILNDLHSVDINILGTNKGIK